MRRHTTRHLVLAAVTALAAAGMVLAPITGTSVARADAVIYVTTTAQKIGGPGGCSLEEAILAANHDSSSFAAPGNDSVVINSGCTAGNGADTIVLAQGAVYQMGQIIDDLYNEMGPTATPVITSPIAISGSGAVIERTTTSIVRAFAVGQAGSLALSDVDVRGFAAHGGRGAGGGGGGLGAGGAIYVHGGSLLVQSSTFEGNGASGGDGSGHGTSTTGFGYGGGGGGLGGNGGYGSFGFAGGGGGSRGNGAAPGGGGGTLTDGTYPDGGARCGGDVADGILSGDGEDGQCDGGGGGGGASGITGGDGGTGAYGGGGGGGADDGGHGGFGGGGGGGDAEQTLVYGTWEVLGGGGGDAGFGGGGGAGPGGLVFGGPGSGGTFGGNATKFAAGGGAGLGGAIFGNSASITVINSTFTGNYAVRGVAGGSGADNGADAGGAIFTVGGSLSVNSSTISGNDSTGDGAGIVVYKPTTGEATSLSLYNTIIAGNGSSGGNHDECFVRGGVAVVGANNLITPHATDALTPCPGITQTGDPLLSALALNAPGTTPTMALDAASPAVDAGDAAMSPLNDQRGVGRPQGNGPDVGAYELITDFTAPLATPTQNPAANGNGWNNTAVTVSWNWADEAGGSGIDSANCTRSSTSSGEGAGVTLTATCSDLAGNLGSASYTVNVDLTAPAASPTQSPAANGNGWNNTAVTVNWNWADTGGSGIDSTNCTTSSTTSGEGAGITLTATCNDLASNQGSASHVVNVDLTAPKVTCAATPTFVIGSTSPGSVTATVTDGLSGPASSPVTAVVTLADLATAGVKSKSLTGYDNAGNSTTVSCPYIVAYNFLGFLQPIPQSVFQRGSAIPVKFRLGDAGGNPISDAAALALLSPVCLVQVTFDDKVMGCATYDATGDYFQFNVKVPKSTSIGAHIVGVTVSAPDGSGIVNKESTPVAIGR